MYLQKIIVATSEIFKSLCTFWFYRNVLITEQQVPGEVFLELKVQIFLLRRNCYNEIKWSQKWTRYPMIYMFRYCFWQIFKFSIFSGFSLKNRHNFLNFVKHFHKLRFVRLLLENISFFKRRKNPLPKKPWIASRKLFFSYKTQEDVNMFNETC